MHGFIPQKKNNISHKIITTASTSTSQKTPCGELNQKLLPSIATPRYEIPVYNSALMSDSNPPLIAAPTTLLSHHPLKWPADRREGREEAEYEMSLISVTFRRAQGLTKKRLVKTQRDFSRVNPRTNVI